MADFELNNEKVYNVESLEIPLLLIEYLFENVLLEQYPKIYDLGVVGSN